MKPLVLLLIVFGASCLAAFISGKPDYYFCGRLALTVMLVFTSIAHFKFTRGMVMMLPNAVPYKKVVVYVTGILEILAGIGLLIQQARHPVAWLIILFFALLLPANIYAAKNKVDMERAEFTGYGISYLWFRVPLQLFFIAWVYYFGLLN